MDDAHVRVFCKELHDSWGQFGHWYLPGPVGGVEYIRADVARKVRPLVWKGNDPLSAFAYSTTNVGQYQIRESETSGIYVQFDGFFSRVVATGCTDKLHAQKAAQDDYETLTLSGLVDL